MIKVENITKIFGLTLALDDVSFAVEEGDIVGLLGPNGAGKTTLMRILSGYMPPTSGRAIVSGYNVATQAMDVRSNMGYFLEKVPLYPEMRVTHFLGFVAEVKHIRANRRMEMVHRVMEECGLGKVGKRIIGNLSKGYKQRVGLAQALLNDPKVLILDEPTIGLDPEQAYDIRNLIKNLGGERTVMLSSHILPEVNQICDKVIILDKGRVVAADSSQGLVAFLQPARKIQLQIEGPHEKVTKDLELMSSLIKLVSKEKVTEDIYNYTVETDKDKDFPKEFRALMCNNQWVLREMKSLKMSLEEIFLEIMYRK